MKNIYNKYHYFYILIKKLLLLENVYYLHNIFQKIFFLFKSLNVKNVVIKS